MPELTKLLEQLAEKLGTTVEHLWKVLLQQAEVEKILCSVWMNIALYGFGGIFLAIVVIFILWIVKGWDEDGIGFLFFVGVVIFITGICLYYCNYSNLLTLTNNPEYWALQEILKQLK
jgi:hypothetical protein